eukprot:Pgem_evm1s737
MQDFDFVEDAPWDSRWNSQSVMVAKSGDQGWRMCANLASAHKQIFVCPIMTEGKLMEEIGDKKCFTVLDCAKGNHQRPYIIPIFISCVHDFSPKTQIDINLVLWAKVADQFENYPQFNEPITAENEFQGSIQHVTEFINHTIKQSTSTFKKQLGNNTTKFHVLPNSILIKLKTAQRTKKLYKKIPDSGAQGSI